MSWIELGAQRPFSGLCSSLAAHLPWWSKFSSQSGSSPGLLQKALCFTLFPWLALCFVLPLPQHLTSLSVHFYLLFSSPRQLHAHESSVIYFLNLVVKWSILVQYAVLLCACESLCSCSLPGRFRSAVFVAVTVWFHNVERQGRSCLFSPQQWTIPGQRSVLWKLPSLRLKAFLGRWRLAVARSVGFTPIYFPVWLKLKGLTERLSKQLSEYNLLQ